MLKVINLFSRSYEMRKNIIIIAFTVALFSAGVCVTAEKKQRENVIILIDLSNSALHVKNELFAKKAARHIEGIIDGLTLGSFVELRTFGEYDRSKNILSFSFMLSRKKGHRKAEVKRNIALFIGNLPKLIRDGKLILQDKTSLIGELKILSERIDKNRKTRIIVFSDMFEYSADADSYKLIKTKNGRLPEAPDIFNNVEVIALGAGYGCQTSNENDRLKALWATWFEKAGVTGFQYLSDF